MQDYTSWNMNEALDKILGCAADIGNCVWLKLNQAKIRFYINKSVAVFKYTSNMICLSGVRGLLHAIERLFPPGNFASSKNLMRQS